MLHGIGDRESFEHTEQPFHIPLSVWFLTGKSLNDWNLDSGAKSGVSC